MPSSPSAALNSEPMSLNTLADGTAATRSRLNDPVHVPVPPLTYLFNIAHVRVGH